MSEGAVHADEVVASRLFRAIHLPGQIDPDSVKAKCRDGILSITAKLARPASMKTAVQAA